MRRLIAFLLLVSGQAAFAQTWSYQSVANENNRADQPGEFRLVEERPGTWKGKFLFLRLDPCWRNTLDAQVQQREDALVVVLLPAMRGCEQIRLVLRKDGTGGRREVLQGDRWVWDGFPRGLQRKT